MYSIMETAIANKVNPYTYIKYLIEKISPLLDSFGNLTDRSCLKDMVPWSDAFREYEFECKQMMKKEEKHMFICNLGMKLTRGLSAMII